MAPDPLPQLPDDDGQADAAAWGAALALAAAADGADQFGITGAHCVALRHVLALVVADVAAGRQRAA